MGFSGGRTYVSIYGQTERRVEEEMGGQGLGGLGKGEFGDFAIPVW